MRRKIFTRLFLNEDGESEREKDVKEKLAKEWPFRVMNQFYKI